MILNSSSLSKCLSMLVYGEDGSGKTKFWLTAPGKIRVFNFDRKPEAWWEPYLVKGIDHEQVVGYKQEAPLNGETDEKMIAKIKDKNSEIMEKFFQSLESAWKSSAFSTIVIDNGTEVNSVNKLAEFGKVSKIMPTDYPALRNTLRRMTNLASQYGAKNFIITCEENEKYAGNKGTGIMKQDMDKTIRHASNVILHMTKKLEDNTIHFKAVMEKCTLNNDLVGMELDGDNGEIEFDVLHELIFG